jgi:hypothetical protein
MLRRWFGARSRAPFRPHQPRFRPHVDGLEARLVPTWSFQDLNAVSANSLLQNLTNGKDTVKNVVYSGAKTAAALFTDTTSSTGITSGVVLSTGGAALVAGPNNMTSQGTSTGIGGDADLDAIISPVQGFDACSLTFDYIPRGGFVNFTFVFGSEEYPEFAPPNASTYNDVFAFFVNGQNVATLPGTTIAVSVENVNAVTNQQYFVNNSAGTRDTQMDGFTTVLTVAFPVTPGKTNQIKLAIEDAFDTAFDSWVLIKTGSLQSAAVSANGPVRYTYNSATGIYTGPFTLRNDNPANFTGTVYVIVDTLPAGVTVANATGTTPSGKPYIAVAGGINAYSSKQVNVSLKNPMKVALPLFNSPGSTNIFVTNVLF